MQQIQFANQVKKTENRNRKNGTHVKKNKILHKLYRTPEEILKVRVHKFLGCHGYLPEAKSLWKSPIGRCFFKRDRGPLDPLPPSIFCQWLFSITNILIFWYEDIITLIVTTVIMISICSKKVKLEHYERCLRIFAKFAKLNPGELLFFSFFRISKTYIFTLGFLSINDGHFKNILQDIKQ